MKKSGSKLRRLLMFANSYYLIDTDDKTTRAIKRMEGMSFIRYMINYLMAIVVAIALSFGGYFSMMGDYTARSKVEDEVFNVIPPEQPSIVEKSTREVTTSEPIVSQEEVAAESTYIETHTPVDMYVDTYALNIRNNFSEDAEVIHVSGQGEILSVIAKVNTPDDGVWLKIALPGHSEAYARSEFVTDENPTEEKIVMNQLINTKPKVMTPGTVDGNSVYLGEFKITYYCGCAICCGVAGNPTASGVMPTAGRTVAADPSIPFGTKLVINGYEYVVEDRGGAIKGNRIDIYENTHAEALNHYVVTVPVYKVI